MKIQIKSFTTYKQNEQDDAENNTEFLFKRTKKTWKTLKILDEAETGLSRPNF
jgi:hypothetical protein